MQNKLVFILLVVLFSFALKAQGELETSQALWEEQLSENPDTEFDLYQWAESFSLFDENKRPLNFSSQEELLILPYLDVFKVNNLLQHIQHTGPILSAKELSSIKGFDSLTVVLLLQDFNLKARNSKEKIHWPSALKYGRQQLYLRTTSGLEKRAAYTKNPEDGGFLGSAQDYLIRYRFNYRNTLQAAFNLQKDAGEAWQPNGRNLGFDFFSGHVALRNYGIIEELIIGDYNAEFGQGLALWSSMSLGRSFSSADIKRYGRGIVPYAGSDENRFYRGIASSLKWEKLRMELFLSHKKIDARVGSSLAGDSLFSESFGGNGLYRTYSEMEKKDRNTLTSMGGRVEFRGSSIDLGINYRHESLAIPLAPSTRLYQMKNFSGTNLQNLSLDWNYIYRSFNLFGEFALDGERDLAYAWGFQTILLDNLRCSYHYRKLGIDYQSIWNAPFAAKGTAGEKGHYLGFDWQINRKLSYNGFFDQQEFRWISFRESSPSKGFDWQNNFKYRVEYNKDLSLRLSYRTQESAALKNGKLQENEGQQFHIRLQLEDKQLRKLESKTTLQLKTVGMSGQAKSTGFMIAQDFRHGLRNNQLKISYRLALINSPNYASRLYSYERDLYLSFSIPAYYGESLRFFILGDWKVNEHLKVQAKYALSYFHDTESISSGSNEIQGPIRSDIRAQIVLKL
tara:strand:+ start:10591 stop:12630 length:2040 start_codon:yes stop_codon:yes gene_type:complete